MDKSTQQIIIEEIQHVLTGAFFNQLSAQYSFHDNTLSNCAYMLDNIFRRLNLSAGTTYTEQATVLITIVAFVTQTFLAYQRNQENKWNETIPLAEISCNFIATAAPAIITYFQHHRAFSNQSNADDRQTTFADGQEIDRYRPPQNISNQNNYPEATLNTARPSPF